MVPIELDRRNYAEFAAEASVVEPVDVDLEVLNAAPGTTVADRYGLEDRVHRRGEGVVLAIALRPDRRHCSGFGESLRVADSPVSDSAVAVMDQLQQVAVFALPGPDAHLGGVEDDVGAHVP